MSVVLVDQLDNANKDSGSVVGSVKRKKKSGKRYKKVGLNDLIFRDEDSSKAGDEEIADDASIASIADDASTQSSDYVGLNKMGGGIPKPLQKRSRIVFLVVVIVFLIGAGMAVFWRNGEKSTASKPHNQAAAGGNNGSTSGNDHDKVIPGTPTNEDDDDEVMAEGDEGEDEEGEQEVYHMNHRPTAAPTAKVTYVEDVDTVIGAWPTAAPLKSFSICPPKIHFQHYHQRVVHMQDIVTVPEDPNTEHGDDEEVEEQWEYTFSDLDISEDASIIAVGLSDFGSDYDYSLGMVRVYAHSCEVKATSSSDVNKQWKQLGQDLTGSEEDEGFGYAISSTKSGKVMAISAMNDGYKSNGDWDNPGNGFVEVYYLDESLATPTWKLLGQRIEKLEDTDQYWNLGSAIDLSDNGETLAIMAVLSSTQFMTRVFRFDSEKSRWVLKGHDLGIEINADDWFSYSNAKLTLSEDGDRLSVVDPVFGLIIYDYQFETNKWSQTATRMAQFDNQDSTYVNDLALDTTGTLVAYAAYDYWAYDGEDNSTHPVAIAKVVDFTNDTAMVEVYQESFDDTDTSLRVDVSKDGTVAAMIASRSEYDDAGEEYAGSLSIISKNKHDQWKLLGKGQECDKLGVPGTMVTLSGDGSLAAVGSDRIISLYGIALNHDPLNVTTPGPSTPAVPPVMFDVCLPFPNATNGDLDYLVPHNSDKEQEHQLSVALSANASIVAVGMDISEEETNGMVRVFGWHCQYGNYTQLGQDLVGSEALDSFGISVDLSSDGRTLVVGASQPPPGKTGYVDVYRYNATGFWQLEKRISGLRDDVEEIGREVAISSDATTVAIHGSIINPAYYGYLSSFVRVVEYSTQTNDWVAKGSDLVASVVYDAFGSRVKLAVAADGSRMAITGSYSSFTAKLYSFDTTKSNWTETTIPPLKAVEDDDDNSNINYYDWDEYCESYFDGTGISLTDDGDAMAVAGTLWAEGYTAVRLISIADTGGDNITWTLSDNAVNFVNDYKATSIALSGNGTILAVGLDMHGDTASAQGSVAVCQQGTAGNWTTLSTKDGRAEYDELGAQVAVSSNGRLAAASSRRGYISFYKALDTN